MTLPVSKRPIEKSGIGGRLVASVVAISLGFASLLGFAPAALAATPGITSEVVLNGETYNGMNVVKEGDALTLKVAYDQQLQPGAVLTFELGTAVSLSSVPKGNSAIDSITQVGNTVTIKFKNPIPVNQGVFNLGITMNSVEFSGTKRIDWKINGEEFSVDLIVKNTGDEFSDVKNGSSKAATVGNLGSFVVLGADCKVTLNSNIDAHKLKYTLKLDSVEARDGFTINDQLPPGLGYVASSFKSTLTSWDAKGLNKGTVDFSFAPAISGNAFTSSVNVPVNSKLVITYDVVVTEKALIEKSLSDACAARKGVPGEFSTSLINTATFGTETKSATAKFAGRIAGIGVGKGDFEKRASVANANVQTDENGTLTPSLPVTFSLIANLGQWDGRNSYFELTKNVVIFDELPAQASWDTGAADFITASGITLTKADTCTSRADFTDNAFVGTYCVNGQMLMINIGKNSATSATVAAKALINSTTNLPAGATTVKDATAFKFSNNGKIDVGTNGGVVNYRTDTNLVVLPETEDGYNDEKAFSKTGPAKPVVAEENKSIDVDYNFAVGAGKGIDMRTSKLVDYVDASLFKLDDLAALPITGKYSDKALTRTHFVLEQDVDGNLVITLSEAGKKVVETKGADKAFSVKITLTTQQFDGKETKSLKNRGTLFGANDEPLYWSEANAEATSYGDEAEVRKRLIDPATGDAVTTLDAEIGADGALINDIYTYRVEFIPHGSYNNVPISDVTDVLPSTVDFLGFVTAADAATGANPTAGPISLNGNIEATYANGNVMLKQKTGTKLQAGQPIEAFFAVKVNNATAPIVNAVGSSTATINPVSTFGITKTVTGVQANNTSVPAEVVVTASWVKDGVPESKTLTVLADGTTVTPFGENLPVDTEVTLSEQALVDTNGIVWGTPTWAGAGVEANAQGSATVTIGETDEAGVALENHAGTSVGSVLIEKILEGDAKDLVTLDGYDVRAQITGQPDRVVRVSAGSTAQLDNLPVGATVTFTEAKPVDTDELTWAAPVISPESIEITADHLLNPAAITVTNSVSRTVGTFEIVKNVTGAEANNGSVPASVEVTATWNSGSKVLTVPTDGTPVAFDENLLIGTQVSLTEKKLEDGDGIAWAAPAWSGTGVTLGAANDATVTIGRDAAARVTLENHAATSSAGLSLLKQVAGSAAGEVDPDTEFTVRASWDLGAGVQTKDLAINAVDPVPLGIDLPAGTVVTLEEIDLPAVKGVVWGAVDITGNGVATDANGVTQVTVSAQQGAVELVTVTNEATWAPGTFNLTKVVTGVPLDHPDVPANVNVRATWVVNGETVSKDISVPTDGTPVPFGEQLPYETQVILAETEAGNSASFTWATPEWAGDRVTDVTDGTAEVIIGADIDPVVTLTNAAVATTGALSVTKYLGGDGAADVAEGTEFPVTATWTDLMGEKQERKLTLTADKPAIIEDVTFGTEITLSEGDRPDTGDIKWLSATWASLSEGAKLAADGTEATVTITGNAGDAAAVTLTNEYDAAPTAVDSNTETNTENNTGTAGDDTNDEGTAGNGSAATGLSETGAPGVGVLVAFGAVLVAGGAWLLVRRRNA